MRIRLLLLLGLVAGAVLAVSPNLREELLERIKDASDEAMITGLRLTSEFGRELTDDRRAEQPAFRQRRLRDLR